MRKGPRFDAIMVRRMECFYPRAVQIKCEVEREAECNIPPLNNK